MGKTQDVQEKEWASIGIGDQVKHPKWGVGTVLIRTGSDEMSRVIVVFEEEGQKKLMLRYAKLKKVSSASKNAVAKAKVAAAKIATESPPKKETKIEIDAPVEDSGVDKDEVKVEAFEENEENQFSGKAKKSDEQV